MRQVGCITTISSIFVIFEAFGDEVFRYTRLILKFQIRSNNIIIKRIQPPPHEGYYNVQFHSPLTDAAERPISRAVACRRLNTLSKKWNRQNRNHIPTMHKNKNRVVGIQRTENNGWWRPHDILDDIQTDNKKCLYTTMG